MQAITGGGGAGNNAKQQQASNSDGPSLTQTGAGEGGENEQTRIAIAHIAGKKEDRLVVSRKRALERTLEGGRSSRLKVCSAAVSVRAGSITKYQLPATHANTGMYRPYR